MTITSYNVPQQLTSVRLAATGNVPGFYFNGVLNNGVGAILSATSVGQLVIDGVGVNQGDRILLGQQTNANENGIYVVNVVGSPISLWSLERSADFQSSEQLIAGQFFTVDAGTLFAGNLFVLTEPLPAQIGSGATGFNFVNVGNSGGGGPFLTVAGNLNDLNNRLVAFSNFGFGSGQSILITDTDFSGGIYTLTNPCPKFINITINNPGAWILRLPPAQDPTSFIISQGPTISVFSNVPGSSVQIELSDGSNFYNPPEDTYGINVILTDNSTVPGSWDGLFFVEDVFCIDAAGSSARRSGEVFLNSDLLAADTSFTPANYTPASGVGFAARSITGYLKGIDNAIAGGVTSAVRTIYLANDGIDSPGRGGVLSPYATLSFALSQIVPSSTTPFQIYMNPGVYTEVNLSLLPWVYIEGNSSQLTVSGSVTLDASWSAGGEVTINNFVNIAWPASVTLDFNAVGAPLAVFKLSNNFVSGSTALTIIGHNINGAIVILEDIVDFSGAWPITINNCYGAVEGGDIGNLILNHTSESAGGNFTLLNITHLGTVNINDNTAAGLTLFHSSCQCTAAVNYTESGAGTLLATSRANLFFAPLTLDNGVGGGNVNLLADVLSSLPILVNGATFSPYTIGDASAANNYFTPSNYTPTAGAPGQWTANSVVGNLKGIDLALASASSILIHQQLWVNFADGNDANDGNINSPMKTFDHAMAVASASATSTNQYLIHIIGDQTLGGDFSVYPYVHIDGHNSGLITVPGFVSLNAIWQTLTGNLAFVKNCKFSSVGGALLNWGLGVNNIVYFIECDFFGVISLFNTADPSETSGQSNILYIKDQIISNAPFSGGVQIQDTELVADNVFFQNFLAACSGTAGAAGCIVTIKNSSLSGTFNVIDGGTGSTVFVDLENSPEPSSPILTGPNTTLQADVPSYLFIPTFAGGASINNVTINNLTDGMIQTSYTPVNYTPTGSANYAANSLTGNLAGIDAQLGVAVGVGTQNIVWVGTNGVDTPSHGTFDLPYATIAYAMSQITTASLGNPFLIMLGKGNYTQAGFAIKPFVDIDGNGSVFTATSAIFQDASWSGGGKGIFRNFNYSSFPSGINLDFSSSAAQAQFLMQNISTTTNDTFDIIGSGTAATQVDFQNIFGFTINRPSLNVQNVFGSADSCQLVNLFLDNNDVQTRRFNVVNCNVFTALSPSCENGDFIVNILESTIFGGSTASNTAPGQLTIHNNSDFSSLTLNGDSNLIFNTMGLTNVPSMLGSPVINYIELGSTISAAYTSVNYTAVNPEISGHLQGIDNALGGQSGQFAVLGYVTNANATTFGATNTYTPIVLNTVNTSANTSDFSLNTATGEMTYTGPVPITIRISCMTSGIAGLAAQNVFVAPAANTGGGYVPFSYLELPNIFGLTSLAITTTAITAISVSPCSFQMQAKNVTTTTSFTAQLMYFSVEVVP